MQSTSDTRPAGQTRTYNRAESIVFLKTKEAFGGLSNMAGGFPLWVNGIRILTAEALYQACRFPHLPEVQKLIIAERSPMTAKMKSKPYRDESRPDWDRVRIKVMRWCLRAKLAQNWEPFSTLLLETGDRSIVEESWKDDFWGAKPEGEFSLVGSNVLGRLLMELREAVKADDQGSLLHVDPISIPNFLLYGQPIETVVGRDAAPAARAAKTAEHSSLRDSGSASYMGSAQPDPQIAKGAGWVELRCDSSQGAGLANLNSYPAMKDSGVPWLGPVPSTWAIVRNGRLFTERKETGFGDLPILEVSLKTGVRVRNLDASSRKQVMADREKYKRARSGDLAYNMMRMWQGAIGMAPVDGLVSPAYVVARPFPGIDSRYFEYLFRTDAYMGEVDKFSHGIVKDRNRLYWEEFKQIPSPFPPPDEQIAIARFLDRADLRIRRYIGAKQKLIKLLEEQQQAIIRRVVTRGLDPRVRLKASHLYGLGEVPEHWRVVSLKYLATKFGSGVTPRGGAAVYKTTGVPFLRSQNVHFGGLRLLHVARISREMHQLLQGTHVQPGDVLLNITGASIGRACAISSDFVEGNVNQHVCIIRPRAERLLPGYLAAFLSTPFIQREIRYEQNGASREGLTLDSIRSFEILLPTVAEQEIILAAVREQTRQISVAVEAVVRQVELLREYRTRLIADSVTGRLDVREAERHFSEESLVSSPFQEVNGSSNDEIANGDEDESEGEEIEA